MAFNINLDFTNDNIDLLSRNGIDREELRPLTILDPNDSSQEIPNPDLLLNKIQWRRKFLKQIVRGYAIRQKRFENEALLPNVDIPVEE